MKRLMSLLLGTLCAVCLVFGAACKPKPKTPELGLAISQETATIDITQSPTLQLSATVTASGNYVFSWTSSNKNVANVHPTSGLVTAVTAGTATITVSVREKGTVKELDSKSCVVNVTTPEGYYNIVTGTSGVAQNENVKADPGVWYLYYGSALDASALYCVKDTLNMSVSAIKGTWYLRYYPKFTAGTMVDISFTVTLDVDAYLRLSMGSDGGIEYRELTAGTHDITFSRVLGDIPFSVSLTTTNGNGIADAFYAGDLNLKLTGLSFTEGVKLTGPDGSVLKSAYINVAQGESTLQLDALAPAGGDDILWSSSEEGVATVDQTGLVTAVDAGQTTITAASGDKKAECTVNVITKEITLNSTYVILDTADEKAPKTYQLAARASDNSPLQIEWRSDNTEVATVDANGLVTAVAAGGAMVIGTVEGMEITCTVAVGNSAANEPYSAELDKTANDVLANPNKWYSVGSHAERVEFAYDNGTISTTRTGSSNARTMNLLMQPLFAVGTTYTVSFTVDHNSDGWGNATDHFHYGVGRGYNANNVGNDKIVTEHADALKGNIPAATYTGTFVVEAGNPFFISFRTAKSNAVIRDITFTKVADPEKSSLTGLQSYSATLTLGDSESNTVQIEPIINRVNEFDEVVITYTSANNSIATVDENGLVTAVAVGSTKIIVSDGTNTKEFTVVVSDGENPPPVVLVSISPESATLDKAGVTHGNTVQIEATYSDASGCPLTYASSDNAVATVDASGLVTAVAVGECTITVSDGTNEKTCTITVENSNAAKLTSISAENLMLDLANATAPNTAQLTATVTGEGVENVTVTWSTDNAAVAAVDENGNITVAAAGVANITATDGTHSKTCKVVVGDSGRELGEYTLSGDAANAVSDPAKYYGYGDSDPDFAATCNAEGKINVAKANGKEKSFYLYYQPLLSVGTKYNVSITITRNEGKNLGTIKRLQFGTGTAYNSAADPSKVQIVTDNTGTNYAQNSLTLSGTFTVDGSEPFYICFRTTNTGFTFEFTFTPVEEAPAAQTAVAEALPANGKENAYV